ncbi:hypothetical protein JW968_04235 [Candidatus Woesearchaeota archaeon]|nr:hypothetical protein [Candidatus Woesearchaeota archaeon]
MVFIEGYKQDFAKLLAETGSLFFDNGLKLKDKRETPYFVNMGIFNSGRLINQLGEYYADMLVSRGMGGEVDIIFGPSYKGSAIAVAMVSSLYQKHGLDLKFVYDRKEEKTHGEATKAGSMWVGAKFFDGCRVYLVDDVGTSMQTKYDAIDMLAAEAERQGIKINLVGVGIGVDREQTGPVYDTDGAPKNEKGTDAIRTFADKTGIPVHSVIGIREIVQFLHENQIPVKVRGKMRPIDEVLMKGFEAYMRKYGVGR